MKPDISYSKGPTDPPSNFPGGTVNPIPEPGTWLFAIVVIAAFLCYELRNAFKNPRK